MKKNGTKNSFQIKGILTHLINTDKKMFYVHKIQLIHLCFILKETYVILKEGNFDVICINLESEKCYRKRLAYLATHHFLQN